MWWSRRQITPWPARLKLPGFVRVGVTNVAARRATTGNLGWLDHTGQLVGQIQPGQGALQLEHPALTKSHLVVTAVGGNDAGFVYLL